MSEQIGGQHWPHSDQELVPVLNRIADRMVQHFTPHAIHCTDVGCGPASLPEAQVIRYYTMLDLADWLRNETLHGWG